MAGKDMNYYAKRGYLGQQKLVEANTPQMVPSEEAQSNMAQVSKDMGGTGAKPQSVSTDMSFETKAEADNRNAVAAQRIQEQLDAGKMSQEEAAKIRSRLSLD